MEPNTQQTSSSRHRGWVPELGRFSPRQENEQQGMGVAVTHLGSGHGQPLQQLASDLRRAADAELHPSDQRSGQTSGQSSSDVPYAGGISDSGGGGSGAGYEYGSSKEAYGPGKSASTVQQAAGVPVAQGQPQQPIGVERVPSAGQPIRPPSLDELSRLAERLQPSAGLQQQQQQPAEYPGQQYLERVVRAQQQPAGRGATGQPTASLRQRAGSIPQLAAQSARRAVNAVASTASRSPWKLGSLLALLLALGLARSMLPSAGGGSGLGRWIGSGSSSRGTGLPYGLPSSRYSPGMGKRKRTHSQTVPPEAGSAAWRPWSPSTWSLPGWEWPRSVTSSGARRAATTVRPAPGTARQRPSLASRLTPVRARGAIRSLADYIITPVYSWMTSSRVVPASAKDWAEVKKAEVRTRYHGPGLWQGAYRVFPNRSAYEAAHFAESKESKTSPASAYDRYGYEGFFRPGRRTTSVPEAAPMSIPGEAPGYRPPGYRHSRYAGVQPSDVYPRAHFVRTDSGKMAVIEETPESAEALEYHQLVIRRHSSLPQGFKYGSGGGPTGLGIPGIGDTIDLA